MDLLKKALNTINKYSMLSEDDRILIGLSGGPDSTCLTLILDKLRKDFNLSLNAVYVDHGLRPAEVGEEAVFCKRLCERLGIGFFSKSVDVMQYVKEKRLSVQEAARELRYQVFDEISTEIKATKIALGHNADDQAETVLMRLLKGAGRRGLSGIPPVRGKIIRPLIEIERKEIEEFLIYDSSLITCHLSLPFIVDSSNLKKNYFRNWIRLVVIPELKKRNPSLIQNICRTADILRDEDAYLELIVTKTLMRLISRKSDSTIELFLSPLETMGKPILRRVLRRAINETKGLIRDSFRGGIDFVHIDDMIKLIKNGKSGDRIYLPKGIRAVKLYSILMLTSEPPAKLNAYNLDVPGELFLKETGILIKSSLMDIVEEYGDGKSMAVFDADKIKFPLSIRARRQGDFFYPSGFGRRKKLQDFFVDNKIPKDERDSVPIVVSGEDIIWVVGHRMDERFKAKEDTKRFLVMKRFKR